MGKTIRNLPRDNEEQDRRKRPRRATVRQNVRQALRAVAKATDPDNLDPIVFPLDGENLYR